MLEVETMEVNYQEILNFLTQFFYVIGPIAVLFVIVEVVTNLFLSFVRGDRRVKL